MRTFGRVETSIWQNWRFHQFSDDEKLLWLYLISQPGGEASISDASDALNWIDSRTRAASERAFDIAGDLIKVVDSLGRSSPPPKRAYRMPWVEWQAIRDAVFSRDGLICRYCRALTGPFEVDHIQPVSRGGSNDLHNLAVACRHCNRSKRDRLDWVIDAAD